MTSTGSIRIEAVEGASHLDEFLRVPYVVHGDDPTWVPPLLAMEKKRLSPATGAFFKNGEAQLFVALRDGAPVGRISAQINRLHLATHNDGAGHFGFFDCIDDQNVANALFDAAAGWLRARGSTRMVGPFNFSINEECGLQIEGFDTPPAVFMTQARPWTAPLLDRAGFDQRRKEELALLCDIFNDSWSGNWGFVPINAEEVDNLLGDFTRFIRGQFCRFALLDGVPVGVMVFLPNYNEPLQGFGGRLLPFNWARLVWTMVADRFHSGRVVILGIRKSVQGTPLAGAMIALLTNEIRLQASGKYDWAEFGWVLEGNRPMVRMCEMAAGPPVKRYRMYGRAL